MTLVRRGMKKNRAWSNARLAMAMANIGMPTTLKPTRKQNALKLHGTSCLKPKNRLSLAMNTTYVARLRFAKFAMVRERLNMRKITNLITTIE